MRRDIAALRRRLGTTTIYVTHDQVEGMTLGDRIVVMRDGRVQQIDTPLALYRRPANTFVATFLGTPPWCLRARGGDRAAGQRDTGLAGRFRRSGSRVVRLVIVSVAPEALHWFDGERETRQPS